MRLSIRFVLILGAVVLVIPSLARAQASLGGTTLGKAQNDERDLANSLVPGAQKFGKGEKKAEVSAAELKSKSIHDATFGGSLLNMGIDSSAQPKLDEAKLRAAGSAADKKSGAAQQPAAAVQKEPAPALPKEPAAVEKGPDPTAEAEPADNQSTFSNLSMTATLADALTAEDRAAEEAKSSSSSGATHNSTGQGPGTTNTGDKASTATSPDPKPESDRK